MERKDSSKKVKTCAVEQSFEYYDTREIATVISRIKQLSYIKTWCIIVHDKDTKENGELKKPHFHAVLTFSNSTTIGAVAKGLHVEPQYVELIRTTTKTAQLYLVHRNDHTKYQYNPSDVYANFDYSSLVAETVPKVKRESIAEKIAKGEIKEYNIYDYITCDEYSRNKSYYNNCFAFRQGLIKNMERNLMCMYISGSSGVGKTTFAKMVAESCGYHAFISSTGNNPLDDYKGEECIIMDDLRDDIYKFSDILKLSDNNTNSLVGCRFYNKSIAECKLLIVTSVQTIEEFYSYETKEEQKQLYRRFNHYMKMEKDIISTYEYKELIGDYVYCGDFKNPVSEKYNENFRGDFFYDLQNQMSLESAGYDEKKV